MPESSELVPGTLDLLILRTLSLMPLHGVAIADRIEQVTHGIFVIGPGSLFPALHRLAHKGWIKGKWMTLDDGRRVKTYSLSSLGRAQLEVEKRNWKTITNAMDLVLRNEG